MNKITETAGKVALPGEERASSYLSALRACQELIFASFERIDAGRATAARELFVEEGVHTLNGQVFAGEGLTEFFKAREANVERVTRHCVANLRFHLQTEATAEALYTSVVYVLPHHNPGAVVDIRDSFIKRDSPRRWFLTRREVVLVAGSR